VKIVPEDIKAEREEVELTLRRNCSPAKRSGPLASGEETPGGLVRSEDLSAMPLLNDDVDLTQPKCSYKISSDGGDLRVARR